MLVDMSDLPVTLIAILSVAVGILCGFAMGARVTRTRYENAIEDAVRRNRLVR